VNAVFYISAAVALLAALRVITGRSAVHALLHLVLVALALAVMFYVLGAPFLAALQVIVYAGAVIMLFLFVVMMLVPGPEEERRERLWLRPRAWIFPAILALVLLGEVTWLLAFTGVPGTAGAAVGPREAAVSLYRDFLVGVELASILLLAGMIGAFYMGLRRRGAEPGEAGDGEDGGEGGVQ
jgi:NADH-quinone oxidoreductase subunit J